MSDTFFHQPVLNNPYERPARHWELTKAGHNQGQPTGKVLESRRPADFITPIPKPKKRDGGDGQSELALDSGVTSDEDQQYDPKSVINEIRNEVERWRNLKRPEDWQVTPETARLLEYWRHHRFDTFRPFFCQVEAAETAIWLSEVAPKQRNGKRLLEYLAAGNHAANPELNRVALKLATGAGKTTVMAMIIHPQSGEVHASGPDGIATWFIDTDYNEESFFIRHAYFLGAGDPYKSLKSTLKAEIDEEAWQSLYSDTSRPFPKPESGRIAVKVINHLGDEVMKVFRVG